MEVKAGGPARSRMPLTAVMFTVGAPIVVTAIATAVDPSAAREAALGALVAEVERVRAAAPSATCGAREAALEAIARRDPSWADAPCFAALGVAPTGDHALWIAAGAGDFAIHGVSDLDADGEPAIVFATRDASASWWTPPGEY